MDFEYSEDQRALRDLARQILDDRVTNERLKRLDSDPDAFDRETWLELAKVHLLGASLPESCGGSGLGFTELCLLLQEVGRAVLPAPVLPTLVLGALPIARFGSDAQQRAWLPGVATGDSVLTGALVEPLGADPSRPRLVAQRGADGSGWRLSGEKTCVPVVHLAERVVVSARTGARSAGLFLVDPGSAGLTSARQQTTNGEPQFQLSLEGVRGEALGDPEAGFAALEAWLDRVRAAYASVQLGCTERMLEQTAEYGRERRQFDRPIGSFQAFHQRAADAYCSVEALRLATWEAVFRLDDERDARESVQVASYFAGRPAAMVAFACSHLHGGIGSDTDYPLHRYFLWIKQNELQLGSGSDALRSLGRDLAENAESV
ncbi:MAG: acyl-CoA dehydrogenase family protein [Myxococcota bacterium]